MKKILLVEDDLALAKSLKEALQVKDYQVEVADCYTIGIQSFQQFSFDFIILDIQLPDGSGIDLCREIRLKSQLPILFLTANDNENMLVEGLNSGGDDYMTKPFRIKELYARIEALLRRTQTLSNDICICDIHIDIQRREVYLKEERLILSVIDFELLKMLILHKDQVLTRRQLLESIDRDEYFVEDNTLSVHMKRLRDKLGTYHGVSYIETVRGIGYRIHRGVLYGNE
ncbi:MAG: response regulator transcription factor [Coprobacillus sp.]